MIQRDIIEKSMEGIDVVHIMQPLLLGPKAASIAYEKNIAITAGFHTQAESPSHCQGQESLFHGPALAMLLSKLICAAYQLAVKERNRKAGY